MTYRAYCKTWTGLWANRILFQCMIYCIKTIRHSIMYCINDVDIRFSAHDTFLELPSSGILKVKLLESQII